MNETKSMNGNNHLRIRVGIIFTIVGLFIYILGANPAIFGLDRSPVTGFIQIAVFLVGLATICIGGFITLNALWNGEEKSIAADFGLRLVATGYVIAVATGMADVFGLGNHTFPNIPYFGPWQAVGVMIGEAVILVGFLMIIPYPRKKE
ncbi:MAG: hypothetical protein KAJ53_05720 [Anaerolineales bacterium]|nr:hypothetical protein [Anaerolineales bacterium]